MNFDTWYDLYSYPYESRDDAAERYAEEQGIDDPAQKQGFLDSLPEYREIDVQKERQQYTPLTFGDYTPTPLEVPDPEIEDDPDWWDQTKAGVDEAQASGASALAGPVSGFLSEYVSEDLGSGLKGWAEEQRDINLEEAAQVKRPETREEILKRDPDSWYQYTPEFFPTGHEMIRSAPTSLAAATVALPAAVVAGKVAGVVGLAALGKMAVGAGTGMAAGNVASSLQVAGEAYERGKNDPVIREELGVDPDKDFKDLSPEDQQKIDRFATDLSQSSFGHRLYTSGLLEMASFIPYGPLLGRWALEVGLGTKSELMDRELYAEDAADKLVDYGLPRERALELQEKMLGLGPSEQETFIKALVQEGLMGGGFSAFESITGASDYRVNIPATGTRAVEKQHEEMQKDLDKQLFKYRTQLMLPHTATWDDVQVALEKQRGSKEETAEVENLRRINELTNQSALDEAAVEDGFADDGDRKTQYKIESNRAKEQDQSDRLSLWEAETEAVNEAERSLTEAEARHLSALQGNKLRQALKHLYDARDKRVRQEYLNILKERPFTEASNALKEAKLAAKETTDKPGFRRSGEDLVTMRDLKEKEAELDASFPLRTQEEIKTEARAEADERIGPRFAKIKNDTGKPTIVGKVKQIFGWTPKPKKELGKVKLSKGITKALFLDLVKRSPQYKGKFEIVNSEDVQAVADAFTDGGREVWDADLTVEGKKEKGGVRKADEAENIAYAKDAIENARAWTFGDKIFMNADVISGPTRSSVTKQLVELGMFHEPIAHIGLKNYLGGDYKGFLDNFYKTNERDIKLWVNKEAQGYLDEVGDIKNLRDSEKQLLAEEFLANKFVEFGVRDPNIIAKFADQLVSSAYKAVGKRRISTVEARTILAEIQRDYIGGERNIITGDFFDRSNWLKSKAKSDSQIKEDEEKQDLIYRTKQVEGAREPRTVKKPVAKEPETKETVGPIRYSSTTQKPRSYGPTPDVEKTGPQLKEKLKGREVEIKESNPEPTGVKFAKSKKPPKKTMTAYKMFKQKAGKLYPLFATDKEIPIGEWQDAEFIPRVKMPKKAQAMSLAPRGGWHAAEVPAPHLKRKLASGEQRVWAEVEISNDVDWQSTADKNKTRDIRDGVPEGGQYRFKRPANQGGYWRIAGALKIKRVLTDEEVDGAPSKEVESAKAKVDIPKKEVRFAKVRVKAFGGNAEVEADVLAALKAEPKIRVLIDYMTPEELLMLKPENVDRMLDVVGGRIGRGDFSITTIPGKTGTKVGDLVAMAEAGRIKKGWYINSMGTIKAVFGKDASRFTALLSALSPRTSVESNAKNAVNIWVNWIKAGRPTDQKSIYDIMEVSVEKGVDSKGSSVLGAWKPNSVRALASPDPDNIQLSGAKVQSFLQNLMGNLDEVTNDAWMWKAYGIVDGSINNIKRKIPGDVIGTPLELKTPEYIVASASTRRAAEFLTQKTGETWKPAEVQETVWSFIKALTETGASDPRTLEQLAVGVDLSSDIANVPDFDLLLSGDELGKILKKGGYEKQIKRISARPNVAQAKKGATASNRVRGIGKVAKRVGDQVPIQRAEKVTKESLKELRALNKQMSELEAKPANRVMFSKQRIAKYKATDGAASWIEWAENWVPNWNRLKDLDDVQHAALEDFIYYTNGRINDGKLRFGTTPSALQNMQFDYSKKADEKGGPSKRKEELSDKDRDELSSRPFALTNVDAYVSNIINNPDNNGNRYFQDEINSWRFDQMNVEEQYDEAAMGALMGSYPEGQQLEKLKQEFLESMQKEILAVIQKNKDYLDMSMPGADFKILNDDSISQARKDVELKKERNAFFKSALMRANVHDLGPTRVRMPKPFVGNGAAIAEVAQMFENGEITGIKHLSKVFREKVELAEKRKAENFTNTVKLGKGQWVELKQVPEDATQEEADEIINFWNAMSDKEWCTSLGMESQYAYDGPMWVYQEGFGDKAESKLAIRFVGTIEDGYVQEIQSQANDGTIPSEYLPEVKEFAKKVELGEDAQETIDNAESEANGIALAESLASKDAKWKEWDVDTDSDVEVKASILELRDGTYAIRPRGDEKWRSIQGLLDQSREARPGDETYLRRYSIIIGNADLEIGLTNYDEQIQTPLNYVSKEERADRIEILGDNDPGVIDADTKGLQDKYDKFGGRYFLPEEHIRIVTGTLNVRGNGKMPSLEKAHELFVSELKYKSSGYIDDNNRFSFPELTTITNGLVVDGPVYLPKLETIYGQVQVSNRLQEKAYNEQVKEKKGESSYVKKEESYWNKDKDWVYDEAKQEGKNVDRWPPDDWHTGVFLDAPLLHTMTDGDTGRWGADGWNIEGDTKINVPSLELIDGHFKLTGGDQIYPALTRVTGTVYTDLRKLAKDKKPSASAILKMKNDNPLDWAGSGFVAYKNLPVHIAKDSLPSLVTIDGDLRIEYPIRLPSLVSVANLEVKAPQVELRNLTAVREKVLLGRKVDLPNLKYVGSELETVRENSFPSLIDVNGNTVMFDGFINPELTELSNMYDGAPVFEDAGTAFSSEKKDNWYIVYRERNPKLAPKDLARLNNDLSKFPKLVMIEGKEGQTPSFKPMAIERRMGEFWQDKGMDSFEVHYAETDPEMTDAELEGLKNLVEASKEERGIDTPAQAVRRDIEAEEAMRGEGVRFSKKTSQPTASELESEFYRKTGKVKPDTEEPTMGININDKTLNFTELILSGEKTMETRDTDSLRAYVGKRVGIVSTGKGPAQLVGYMTVGEPVVYNSRAEFKKDQSKHLVKTGSDYDIKRGGKKYGYPVTNVERVTPSTVTERGIVARKIKTPLPQDKVSLGNKKFTSGTYSKHDLGWKKLLNPDGNVRSSRVMMGNAAAHAMGTRSWNPLARWTEKTQPFADRLLERMIAQGTLPDSAKYKDFRRLLKGEIYKAEQTGKTLYDILSKSNQKEVIYKYFTTRGYSASMITDRAERQAAIEAKEEIHQIGKELVDRKLLHKAAFKKHEGEYLPQVYLKYLLGDENFNNVKAGGKLNMEYLKSRKDLSEGVRKLLLHQVEDPAYLGSKAVAIPRTDMAILDFLQQIALNPKWVLPQSMVTFDVYGELKKLAIKNNLSKGIIDSLGLLDTQKHQVSAHWLNSEATRIRKTAPDAGLSVEEREAVDQLTEKMLEASEGKTNEGWEKYDPKDYRQIPKSVKYGSLAGMWVRKEIASDLFGGMSVATGDISTAEAWLGDAGIIGDYNRLWKWAKVSANPPSWVRNFVSNMILMNMGGVPVGRMPDLILSSLADMKKSGKHGGKLHQLAKDLGLTAGTFSNVELGRIEREFKDLQRRLQSEKSGPWAVFGAVKGAFNKVRDVTGDIYGGIDSLGKMMMLKYYLDQKGIDIKDLSKYKGQEKTNLNEVAAQAEKWLFDYSNVLPSVKWLRRAPLGAPFISFTSFVAPLMLETAITKPWKFAPYYAFGWAMKEWFKNNHDLDEDDLEGLKLGLSEYLREKAKESIFPTGVVPLPFLDENKRVQWLDISYLYPWGMFSEMAGEVADGQIGQALKTAGMMGSPLFNIASAVSTGIDPFSRREIVDPMGTPTEQAMDIWWYAFNLTMPPFMHGAGPGNEGFGAGLRLYDAFMGNLSKDGEAKFTMFQASMRAVGINITPLAVPEGAKKQLKFEQSRIKKLIYQAEREIKNMYVMQKTPSQIQSTIKDYREKIMEHVLDWKEKVRKSTPPKSLAVPRMKLVRERNAALRERLAASKNQTQAGSTG